MRRKDCVTWRGWARTRNTRPTCPSVCASCRFCARRAALRTRGHIEAIGAGRVPTALPPAEQAIARYIQELFSAQSVSDDAFAELARHFTPRQITDISLSATYYRALGTLVMAFGVEMEPPAVMKIEKDWQKAKAGL